MIRPSVVATFLVVAGLLGAAPASYAAEPLRGEWHLDSFCAGGAPCTEPDSSGNGLGASWVGSPTEGPGRFGRAYNFPSEADYLNAGNQTQLQPANITVVAWVKAASTPTPVKGIVSQGSNGGCSFSSYALYTGGSAPADQGTRFYIHSAAGNFVSPPAPNSMWNDQWHMLAGTYDGATVRLYLDGTEVGSTPAMGNIAYNLASTNDFVIGTLKDPACVEQTNFSGSIDEPRVYSRALTPAEIALLADPSAVTPPELPASYALPLSPKSSCLRREISLVRADVRRRRVVLSGLVQPRFVGQPIRILANYRAAKAGALTRLATVRSNAAGQFKATVRRPARKTFNKARFRAQVDRFRSAPLKLPQSLSSTSIKQVGGQIVLRGKVKRSLLGRRNRVTIKRLVCGRYRTVAGARPGRNGRYVTRFSVPANVAVALFRAETRVLSRPRGRRYVKQYARAISITLTSSTG